MIEIMHYINTLDCRHYGKYGRIYIINRTQGLFPTFRTCCGEPILDAERGSGQRLLSIQQGAEGFFNVTIGLKVVPFWDYPLEF